MKRIDVEVQSDIIEKLSKADPIQAISELIWNGVDADADSVETFLEYDGLDALNKITIKDNGIGFSPDDAAILFKRLGGSWKKNAKFTKIRKRNLHGQEGRGRFKAFALGRVGKWHVVYNKGQKLFEYEVTIVRDNIRQAEISEERLSSAKNTGVRVELTELDRNFKSFESNNAIQLLSENFALYLKNYTEVEIIYNGSLIDPSSVIENDYITPLSNIEDENGLKYSVDLEIIEWKRATKKTLYLCNEKGFPYSPVEEKRFHTGKYEFSAYIKSSYIEKLFQKNTLDVGGFNKELIQTIEQAQSCIKNYFNDKAAIDAKNIVQNWKDENIYPYDIEPKSPIEIIERKVFDIVAININNNLPEFSSSPSKNKKLSLKLLKHSIEKSPEDLQLILTEVLNLPKRQQKELANLLKDTTLSAIIGASKLISDRLKFINGIEEIVFDKDLKNHLKERSQLHQMLAENTWLFGEEFNLSVSDQSLTEVLKKHKKLVGEDIVIDKPVSRIDGRRGIVDLMLSRELKTYRGDEIDHLIIELKAPKIILSSTECSQIEDYAFAVANDERFRHLTARWNFWLLSDDLDENTKRKIKQKDRPEGILFQSDKNENPNVTIWIKTWSQIIRENKARLEFIRERLEFQTDKGDSLKAIRDKYSHLIDGTQIEEIIEEKIVETV